MDIAKIDKNLATEGISDERGLVFRSALCKDFSIHGVFHDGRQFRRIPEDVARATSENVAALSKNTSGGRVRFTTNSRRIAIHATMPGFCRMAHMAFTGIYGFDLYDGERFVKSFIPPVSCEGGYEGEFVFDSEGEHEVTLNMPLYNSLSELYIGLDDWATVKPPREFTYSLPVVFYGSSITQGGCASRPGSCYTAILSRWLDFDFINLGFSGSAKAEKAIGDYIASLDMSVFVLDYDHNAPTPEHLWQTHKPLFDAVRAAHPSLPIIMISRPKHYLSDSEKDRRAAVRATYDAARAAGDKNVYFIDGSTLMPEEIRNEGTVDNCHPTDLGFYFMARRILPVLRRALTGEEK